MLEYGKISHTTFWDMLCSRESLNAYYCNGRTNNHLFSLTDGITLKSFDFNKNCKFNTSGSCTAMRNTCFLCDFAQSVSLPLMSVYCRYKSAVFVKLIAPRSPRAQLNILNNCKCFKNAVEILMWYIFWHAHTGTFCTTSRFKKKGQKNSVKVHDRGDAACVSSTDCQKTQ